MRRAGPRVRIPLSDNVSTLEQLAQSAFHTAAAATNRTAQQLVTLFVNQ